MEISQRLENQLCFMSDHKCEERPWQCRYHWPALRYKLDQEICFIRELKNYDSQTHNPKSWEFLINFLISINNFTKIGQMTTKSKFPRSQMDLVAMSSESILKASKFQGTLRHRLQTFLCNLTWSKHHTTQDINKSSIPVFLLPASPPKKSLIKKRKS